MINAPFGRIFRPPAGPGLSTGVTYLLRDEFTTDASAPLTSPRTCEPGPGTLTITDAGSRLSVSGGKLTSSSNATGASIYCPTQNKKSGIAISAQINDTQNNGIHLGWGTDVYQGQRIKVFSGVVYCGRGSSNLSTPNGLTYTLVLRSSGYGAYCIHETSAGVYKLIFVDNGGNGANPNTPNVAIGSRGTVDALRVFELGAPWNSGDAGVYTTKIASASAGETSTSLGDACIEATWTIQLGATYELDVRRTDDQNCWKVRVNQTTTTVKLIQVEGGVETERSSGAYNSVLNPVGFASRLFVVTDGATIKVYMATIDSVGTIYNTYTSASFNQTATGVKTSHAVSNLIFWPRTLSGAALAELQRYTV